MYKYAIALAYNVSLVMLLAAAAMASAEHDHQALIQEELGSVNIQIIIGVAVAVISGITLSAYLKISGLPAKLDELRAMNDDKLNQLKSEHDKLSQRVDLRIEHITQSMASHQSEILRLLQILEIGLRRDLIYRVDERLKNKDIDSMG